MGNGEGCMCMYRSRLDAGERSVGKLRGDKGMGSAKGNVDSCSIHA